MKAYCILNLLILFSINLFAEIRPSLLISDNMVLQRNTPLPLWGWADKGEKVTVAFNGQTHTAKPDKSGKWMVTLNSMPAGGPYEMTLSSRKSKITLSNVMIGEVWICSGQSNMNWFLKDTENAKQEAAQADYPLIRYFEVPKRVSPVPIDSLEGGQWDICSPHTAPDFTAVGYYYAKELQQELGVAIGLIKTTWGGTMVETWMSAGAAKKFPEFGEKLSDLEKYDLATFRTEQRQYQENKIEELREKLGGTFPTTDGGMENGKAVWADPALDTKDWKSMEMPSNWEKQGLQFLDGVLWFRKEVTLSEDFAKENAVLHLAHIDDSDIAWVNGTKVGSMTDAFDKLRAYLVNADILKVGKNTITIRIEDIKGNGGIWGNPEDFKLASASGENISLVGSWRYKVGVGEAKIPSHVPFAPNSKPTFLFNGMVKALIPYAIKGTIWYQGEQNTSRPFQYQKLFPELIKDWRSKWKQGDFPFLFVQLASFKSRPGQNWPALREAQAMALSLPNTGQAVTIDIGDAGDIHPRNKKDVGKRLALNARKIAYGEEIVHSGPTYHSMSIEGNKVKIKFNHIGGGLMAKDKYGYVKSFAIADADKKFVWAKAEIVGDEVVVYNKDISKPVAVRYAWADNPDDANLYNAEGLPASPFRTDDWKMVKKK